MIALSGFGRGSLFITRSGRGFLGRRRSRLGGRFRRGFGSRRRFFRRGRSVRLLGHGQRRKGEARSRDGQNGNFTHDGRTTVVRGKSVSVRVNPGGYRFI